MDLTNINRTAHATAVEHILFLSTHRTFYRIQLMLGPKARLNKFKKTKILSSIFSNHNFWFLKSEICERRKWEIHKNVESKQQDMAQSVKHLPLGRFMIRGPGLRPTLGSLISRKSASPSTYSSTFFCSLFLSNE